jgi:hypothetical protein
MGLVRFYSTVLWLGISLALAGQLKSCTLTMMGLAAGKSEVGIMSYSKFNRSLWTPAASAGHRPAPSQGAHL